MPSHSKPRRNRSRTIAIVATFVLAFIAGVVVAERLERQADSQAKVVCACTYNVFHICVPWHPPLVCNPV